MSSTRRGSRGGEGIFDVVLPAEDDVMFLAMAYEELWAFCDGSKRHRAFLSDGLLDLTAEREGAFVVVTICHTPHLDRRFSKSTVIKTGLAEYRNAWCNLMKSLLRQIRGDRVPSSDV